MLGIYSFYTHKVEIQNMEKISADRNYTYWHFWASIHPSIYTVALKYENVSNSNFNFKRTDIDASKNITTPFQIKGYRSILIKLLNLQFLISFSFLTNITK